MNAMFNPQYIKTTPNSELNFVGATIKYFDEINKGFKDSTIESYIQDYNNSIFPCINFGKPIKDYDIDYVEDLIKLIGEQNNLSEATLYSTIRHLVYDPCLYYFNEYDPRNNPFVINPSQYRGKEEGETLQQSTLKIIKSLTVKEEMRAGEILLSNPQTDKGEYVGLCVMLFTAARNNECCGFNYGDLIEMLEHPGCYYLQITKSTEIAKSKLKAGGKTYNAFRRLPVVNALKDFLMERMAYLEQVVDFPYQDHDVIYTSVYELPIACRGNNYGARCGANDLTIAGRTFLRDDVGMTQSRLSGIQLCISEDRDSYYDLGEKDVTTYMLRRNFATHLYTLGLSTLESQYYMGHKMEGTALKRSDFGDETFLYDIWLKLQNHPLNKQDKQVIKTTGYLTIQNDYHSELEVFSDTNSYYLAVKNRELADQVIINVEGDIRSIALLETSSDITQNNEINIVKHIRRAYK